MTQEENDKILKVNTVTKLHCTNMLDFYCWWSVIDCSTWPPSTTSYDRKFVELWSSLDLSQHEHKSRNVKKRISGLVRPAKIQMRAVWSESSLCVFWIAKEARFHHVDLENWPDCADAHADLSLQKVRCLTMRFTLSQISMRCGN